ncbi:MAG: tRNA threonylcarbamoyladenosine biosynthesis protein TsaE [Chlamydiia bacterium]|nr:tRNA threonylcarbamoyladenosine biosynthesis protein TsaE [Chlamydiia bacterium]
MSSLLQHFTSRRTTSAKQTLRIGEEIASKITNPCAICFSGDLGAGKTTLIKGIIHALNKTNINEIQSPTFVYMTPYEETTQKDGLPICHFDLYRLSSESEFEALGFHDYLDSKYLCLFEWPDKIPSLFTKDTLLITIAYTGETEREITFSTWGAQ